MVKVMKRKDLQTRLLYPMRLAIKIKEKLFNKKEPELENLENSQPIYIAKIEKACSKKNTKAVDE